MEHFAPRRRVVWIVDDNPRDVEFARQALEGGYHLETFLDGAAVLGHLASHPPPDLMVLDWIMPGVSGLDVCRFLRSNAEHLGPLPILMVTVRAKPEQVVEGLESGADEVLGKPYVGVELCARVRALLRTREFMERAERAEASVRRLLATAPDALLTVDAQGHILFANAEAERALGRPSSELYERRLEEVIPQLVLRNISVGSGESLFPLPDVRVGARIYAPHVRVLTTDDAARTTIALRDVTEDRRAAARRLDFYAIIAHEVRSPLAAISMRLETILSGRHGLLSAELQADLRKMKESTGTLVAMVNDFLELARLEGVGYKIDPETLDLCQVVEATLADYAPLLDAKRLTLDYQRPPRPATAYGDRQRLVQVTSNLLSNAIKFTPDGGDIALRILSAESYVEVQIEDTGSGIDATELPTLFDRYVTGGPAREGGTGLGLMIVREIIEAHGGSIGADSTPGQGSTFWFRLPTPSGAHRRSKCPPSQGATPPA